MGSFSRTRIDVAGSLTLLEAICLAQGCSTAVRITAYLKCRIPPRALDNSLFYSSCAAFPMMHCMLSLVPSRSKQQACVENSVTMKEHFLLNVRNFGIIGTNV